MYRKIDVSVSEMLELRRQGYSNKDICNMLEISLPTVLRYIGKQGCKMDSVTKNPSRSMEIRPPEKGVEEIKMLSQTFAINGVVFCNDTDSSVVTIATSDQQEFIRVSKDNISAFIEAVEKAKQFIGR